MNAEGQVVVITGASSGIGRATARAYARRGARLVLASRSAPALETVAEECRAHGVEVLVVPTDVTEEGEVRALAAAAAGEYGRIDIWVGNAGLFSYGGFEETPAGVFREVVDLGDVGRVDVEGLLGHRAQTLLARAVAGGFEGVRHGFGAHSEDFASPR